MARPNPGFLAPDPAPGGLEVVQAFLNTAAIRKKRDELTSPRELERWLMSRNLVASGVKLSAADHQRAITAREALRRLLAVNSGARFDPKAIDRLEEAMAETRFLVRFDVDGSPRFEPDSVGIDAALGKLLAQLVATWNAGEWSRFKLCGDPTCGAAFYDFSRRAKWCHRRCGDRMRALAYRRGEKYTGRRHRRKVISFLGEKYRV